MNEDLEVVEQISHIINKAYNTIQYYMVHKRHVYDTATVELANLAAIGHVADYAIKEVEKIRKCTK